MGTKMTHTIQVKVNNTALDLMPLKTGSIMMGSNISKKGFAYAPNSPTSH
jgi:hypothetical protein